MAVFFAKNLFYLDSVLTTHCYYSGYYTSVSGCAILEVSIKGIYDFLKNLEKDQESKTHTVSVARQSELAKRTETESSLYLLHFWNLSIL